MRLVDKNLCLLDCFNKFRHDWTISQDVSLVVEFIDFILNRMKRNQVCLNRAEDNSAGQERPCGGPSTGPSLCLGSNPGRAPPIR